MRATLLFATTLLPFVVALPSNASVERWKQFCKAGAKSLREMEFVNATSAYRRALSEASRDRLSSEQIANTLLNLAQSLIMTRQYGEAESVLNRAERLIAESKLHTPVSIRLHRRFCTLYCEQGQLVKAIESQKRLVNHVVAIDGYVSSAGIRALVLLHTLQSQGGRDSDCIDTGRLLVKIMREWGYNRRNLTWYWTHRTIGRAYLNEKKYALAYSYFKQAYDSAILIDSPILIVQSVSELLQSANSLPEGEERSSLYRKSIPLLGQVRKRCSNQEAFPGVLCHFAACLQGLGKYSDAAALYISVANLSTQRARYVGPRTDQCLFELFNCLRAQGKVKESIEPARKAIELVKDDPAKRASLYVYRAYLGEAYASMNRYKEAAPLMELAANALEELPDTESTIADVYSRAGDVYAAAKMWNDSSRCYSQSLRLYQLLRQSKRVEVIEKRMDEIRHQSRYKKKRDG